MEFLRWIGHIASSGALFVLLACALVQTQPRQPGDGTKTAQQQAAPDPRGTDTSPLIVKVQPTQKTDAETAEEQRLKQQEASDRRSTRWLSIATVVLALLQLGAIGFQAHIASRQNRIIEKQNTIMTGQRNAADTQSDISSDALATNRQIERAYIVLFDKPRATKLLKQEQTGKLAAMSAHIIIKNFGRTPGHVVGGFCGWIRQPYDIKGPDLSKVHSGSTLDGWPLLMPGERVDYWLLYPSDPVFMEAMVANKTDEYIWLVGEIDYRDAFNAYHRSGYGRIYRADSERFIQEPSTNALNYDRLLSEDEVRQRGYRG